MNIGICITKNVDLRTLSKDNEKKVVFLKDKNFYDAWEISWNFYKEKGTFSLLASVDPYGDTLLNYNQCQILIEDLKSLSTVSDTDLSEYIKLIEDIKIEESLLLIGD